MYSTISGNMSDKNKSSAVYVPCISLTFLIVCLKISFISHTLF